MAHPTKTKIPDESDAGEGRRRRAAAVGEAHAAAEANAATEIAAFEKANGRPHALGRLNCELARVLAHQPATLEGEPAPTFAEVVHLLRLTATALRRYSGGPVATEAATLVNLSLHSLSAPNQESARKALRRAAERTLDGVGASLKTTPIGDRIAEDLGAPGRHARAGRALQWAAERCLERHGEMTRLAADTTVRFIPPLAPLVERHTALLAREIAGYFGASPQARGIIDLDFSCFSASSVRAKIESAIARKLTRWPPDGSLDARAVVDLREDVAVAVVVAAAKASGFRDAKRRLFDWRRKTRSRLAR